MPMTFGKFPLIIHASIFQSSNSDSITLQWRWADSLCMCSRVLWDSVTTNNTHKFIIVVTYCVGKCLDFIWTLQNHPSFELDWEFVWFPVNTIIFCVLFGKWLTDFYFLFWQEGLKKQVPVPDLHLHSIRKPCPLPKSLPQWQEKAKWKACWNS